MAVRLLSQQSLHNKEMWGLSSADVDRVSSLERDLKGYQTSLERLEEICEILQTKFESAKARREEIKVLISTSLAARRSFMSALCRFPPEILSEIFETSLALAGASKPLQQAINLSHVSRRWRNVAVGNPKALVKHYLVAEKQ